MDDFQRLLERMNEKNESDKKESDKKESDFDDLGIFDERDYL